jgi:peptide-methionine (S)-S-oxide reductase
MIRLWSRLLAPLLLLLLLPLWLVAAPVQAQPPAEAVLAGGCFWCLEHDLETLPGVIEVVSGYSGGSLAAPTYRQVSAGGTGHQEVVRVRFDPARISYATLLQAYWRNVDPFDGGGQFCDRGSSYRPVIFTAGGEQANQAAASARQAARELQRPAGSLKVEIKPLQRFWPAEAYHQDYARRNPLQYNYYRWACGRDRRLSAVWGPRARQAAPWARGSAKADSAKPMKS